MKIFQRVLLGIAFGALASGCVYRINIQQGNFLDQAAVEQVKAGMTRSQVRYLLGTPMVADPFERNAGTIFTISRRAAAGTSTRGASRSISTATRSRGSTSPRTPRRRRRTPPPRKSRTAGLTSADARRVEARACGRCAARTAWRCWRGGARFGIGGQRAVDFDSIAVLQRLIRAAPALPNMPTGAFARSTPAKSGSERGQSQRIGDAGPGGEAHRP